jgi:hypothetical protein
MKKLSLIITIIFLLTMCVCSPLNNIGETAIPPTSTDTYNPIPITLQPTQTKVNSITPTPSFSDCVEKEFYSKLSPDGNWCAAGYGYKRDQKMVVQNQDGTQRVLYFDDFVVPEAKDSMGNIFPDFWSPDSKYVYFSTAIGFSGGGTQCFRPGSSYGLFRLDVESGALKTILEPIDIFPGYLISFSPTGNYLAIDIDSTSILNLHTGETKQINSTLPQSFRWSPDGRYLAYSVATCGDYEEMSVSDDWFFVKTSSAYIYDTFTGQTIVMLRSDKQLLRVENWSDDSDVVISGEQYLENGDIIKYYLFNINSKTYTFIETATPTP